MKKLVALLLPLLGLLSAWAQVPMRQLTVADGLPNNQVRQIVELPNHQMLVATEGFFCLYDGNCFVPLYCNLDSIRPLPVFGGEAYLWQGDSLLWFKDHYSLYLFDTRARRFRYDYDHFPFSPALKRFMQEPTDTVSQRRRQRLAKFQTDFSELVRGMPLQADYLSDYCLDYQGGQWFGTRNNGVIYLPPTQSRVRKFSLDNSDEPRRLTVLGPGRMLVAGASGIYEFDTHTNQVLRTLSRGWFNTLESHRDGQGRVWVCTNQGLFCCQQGMVEPFDSFNVQGFTSPFVRFALPIDERRLLVCNAMHNLGYFYPEERRFEALNPKIPSLDNYRTMIVAAQLTNRNHVGICTQNGFFLLDVAHDKLVSMPIIQQATHFSRKYNCILLDRTGRLWLGTQNGLLMLSDGRLQRYTRADGLSNDCIQGLAEDPAGNIWASTSSGVNRIRPDADGRTLCIRSLTSDDGLPDIEMTERGICMMPDSTLYLATPQGLVAIPTADYADSPQPPMLTLVGLSVAGTEVPLDTVPLHLSYRQNFIDLQVSTLDYAHPNSTRYRYRLLGTGDRWHTPLGDGRLAVVRMGALSPGRYTIEVQASTGDDLWGPPLRKTFVIRPPLWLTWWAKALYLLMAVAMLLAAVHLYIRQRRQKLERENEERVNRLFELREEARRQFAHTAGLAPADDSGREGDILARRVTEVVGANMSRADYTMEQLARDVGMSRANLYKKMQEKLGITPNDFVRNVRLKRAAQLLAETDLPVNQISLMVGFQTPRYFSQCFRQMFGITPRQYRGEGPLPPAAN